jgi:protein-tyrosine phosphatase
VELNFGPARSGEATVFGAQAPDSSVTGMMRWTDFMRAHGISRVCCLLDPEQLASFPVSLEEEFGKAFGPGHVLMEPVPDHHLCSKDALNRGILPFLRDAAARQETVVVHCWGGNGRTGHVLAAWLVAARGLSPMQAVEAVEATGRLPREAINAGNAALSDLIALLSSCSPRHRLIR